MGQWPKEIKEIKYRCSTTSTDEFALFYDPQTSEKAPLLVALHAWSGDYKQDIDVGYSHWCIEKGWVFIHPDFRGPNNRPEAACSDLVVADIIDAVEYAKSVANVDEERIYLVGVSGGGYASLFMAGKVPDIWAGVSAWVPLNDLGEYYKQAMKIGQYGYAQMAVDSCGGKPGDSEQVDAEYKKRSPATYLKNAFDVPIDINAGIYDGHGDGTVPISQTLEAFNVLAKEKDRINAKDIEYFVEKAEVPPHLQTELSDKLYGAKQPLFRRSSNNARVTIFDGGHEIIYGAALTWLSERRKACSAKDN